MTGHIIQISTSRGGVPKRAVGEGHLSPLGIEGDDWAHPQIHGGARQAVLVIAGEVIEELRAAGYPVFPGALGENLTTAGLDHRQFRIGQRYRAGQAIIEFTRIRTPCSTLDVYNPEGMRIQDAIYDKVVKSGDPKSRVWGMSGFYARVEKPGIIRPDDPIVLLDQAV
jgi:MOSC domain-containing protein YiiM